jgi:hydroxypyruvate reductase
MGKTDFREAALDIFRAGLGAADPYKILRDSSHIEANRWHCKVPGAAISMNLPDPESAGRIFAVGAGKAAASLAKALEESLGDRLTSGRIVVKHGHGLPMKRIIIEEGGHPLPDEGGLEGTKRLLDDLGDTRLEDRVFFLLTGGGSALLVAPAEGLSLEDKIETTRLLLGCGATIQEMNTLRKHLSAVKGGRLLERIAPARSTTLIISDVVGDDLASIGSGPTAPDPTTFEDCLDILNRYELIGKVPQKIRARLTEGAEGRVKETPKSADGLFEEAQHLILASNRLSVDAAQQRAGELGFDVEVFAHDMVGSTHEQARGFVQRLVQRSGRPLVLLAGGETTLKVQGTGKGGRNQEFSLVAAREIEGQEDLLVLSAGTDGTDGPTDAAGAFADGSTYARARNQGHDPQAYLRNNDSYRLFDSLGDLLKTGPTGTNVMDLVVGIAGPR